MEVEQAHVDDIAAAEPLAVAQGKIAAQIREQRLAILGPDSAALLKLNDVVADLPVSLGDVGIDGLMRPHLASGINLGDAPEEALVIGRGGEFSAHGVDPIFCKCWSTRERSTALTAAF